jgi:hypothetical protein
VTRLVEEPEAHVVVGLLLLLLFGGLWSGLSSGTTTRSSSWGTTSGSTSTTRWHGGELLRTLGDELCRLSGVSHIKSQLSCKYLVDVLALKLGEELAETLFVRVDANGAQDTLDVLGGRRGVAGQAEEEVCC